ncbi:hypothetical protein DSO57_1015422 [Entomophthora muscae]|uniref:Uncharacterized protein n=1 Tax=Entomophthora muscae TaxID=34485 RepID=A0ACC2T545_9FUNG|nr:hypothetical protein DSO57_1015422 [Entomophthora muscae]
MEKGAETTHSQSPAAGANLTHLLPTGNSSADSLSLALPPTLILGSSILSVPSEDTKGKVPEAGKRFDLQILKINAIQSIAPINAEDIASNESKVQNVPIDHVFLSSAPSPRHLNLEVLVTREQKTIAGLHEKMRLNNSKAPEGGQEIFNALNKMFPCSWDRNDILVLEEVRIRPGYRVENCEALSPEFLRTLDRVKKTLEAERKKLNFDRSPSSTPLNLNASKAGFSGRKDAPMGDKLTDLPKKERKDFSRK